VYGALSPTSTSAPTPLHCAKERAVLAPEGRPIGCGSTPDGICPQRTSWWRLFAAPRRDRRHP